MPIPLIFFLLTVVLLIARSIAIHYQTATVPRSYRVKTQLALGTIVYWVERLETVGPFRYWNGYDYHPTLDEARARITRLRAGDEQEAAFKPETFTP